MATDLEVQREATKQRALVLKEEMEMRSRLGNISSVILKGASSFREKKKLYAGFQAVHRGMVEPEYQGALAEAYHLGSLPKIARVFDNSPCEKAGIEQGDEILSINDRFVPTTSPEVRTFLSSFKSDKVLEMEVFRAGSRMHFTVEQESSCDYPIELVKSSEVNAFADGQAIIVTQGILKYMDNDTELATVISHELAHTVREHVSMGKKNATAGYIGGLLLDIAAGAVGVPTRGAFSKAGQRIGAKAYSMEMEREADYVGVYILAAAGYDIKEAPNVFRRLGAHDPQSIEGKYAVSHPSTPERYVNMEKTVEEIEHKQAQGMPLVPEEKE
jgi:hypothetical protein